MSLRAVVHESLHFYREHERRALLCLSKYQFKMELMGHEVDNAGQPICQEADM
jgi:hypothetical protein